MARKATKTTTKRAGRSKGTTTTKRKSTAGRKVKARSTRGASARKSA